MPPVGFVEARDLDIDEDGHFEIQLSRERQEGNWLPLPEGRGTLIVRQTFLDRAGEQRAELKLECTGAPTTASLLDAEAVDAGLNAAGSLVNACAMIFPGWARGFEKHSNTLPRFDPNIARAFGGDPNIAYYHSHWQLAPDEALVIEATPPDCDFWNFQLNNYWMESLDYRYFDVVINNHGARTRPDRSLRVVVAHEDPGCDNWLSTAGHTQGTMCWRWVRASEHPQPETRVVKLQALREEATQ